MCLENSYELAIRPRMESSHRDVCHTKSLLEYSGCRTQQPVRTWLIGPGAVLVLKKNNTYFRVHGTNQTKGCYRGRKPVSKKLLVRSRRISRHVLYVTHMSHTCHTHVTHMSHTCHTHVTHMSHTCHGNVTVYGAVIR